MRAATSLSSAKTIAKQFRPTRSRWVGGIVPSLEPRKERNEETIKQRTTTPEEKNAEPIVVAFSRPPPFSPFLGPFVLFSLFDSWSKNDSNEA